MLLDDLINNAKTTETITKHLEQIRLEDANYITRPTTSINALVNKVAHEQQRPRKRFQQNRFKNCNGKYPHERGQTSCPAFQNQCAYCQRWGYFTSVCFRKLNDGDRQRRTNCPTPLPLKLVIPNKLLTPNAFLGSGSPRIAFTLTLFGLMPSLPKVCPRNFSYLLLYSHFLPFRGSPFLRSRLNIAWRF